MAVDSAVRNIKVTGTMTGSRYIGMIVGNSDGGIIENISVEGSVTGTYSIGGIVGNLNETKANAPVRINKCVSSANVTGTSYVGGIVGYDNCAKISNAYSIGTIKATNGCVGGLIGYVNGNTNNNYTTEITNTYSIAKVEGNNSIGGLIGYTSGNYITITSSYWTTETAGVTSSRGGTDLQTKSAMKIQSNFVDWDFVNIWIMGNEYPELR